MLRDRVKLVGTQTAVADELGISKPYLNDILSGKRAPGPSVLQRLGLRKTEKYEREEIAE